MTKQAIANREEKRNFLRERIVPGQKVYTTVTHVAKSGMSRSIKAIIIGDDKEPFDISGFVAQAIDAKLDHKNGGVKMSGCGMNMCFALVYRLSGILFPDGFTCVGERCPSSDHSNGDRVRTPHKHESGGYALRYNEL